ncbi:hypothetical protein [Mycolicibacterium sp. CR10]|uniref:hypothetical protein n=1 Tax=Mycolicibacterium sp. CR10 TaxID=2562314 RepID=UPI0010C13BF9|nr:hypothetical protein [Mycolicibacterium sp. CR10]
MKRRTVVTDRLSCAVAGGALIALGVSAAAWEPGKLPVPAGAALTMPWLPEAANSAWWPFALGAVALLLIVVGVSWLIGHRPGQTVGTLPLTGSGATGLLTVDLNTAASAAAADLARHPHIAAASGTSLVDRGQRVIEIDVKIEPTADGLALASTAVDAARRDLAVALDGVPVSTRILLRTPREAKGASRVR